MRHKTIQFLNELSSSKNRYRRVTEESVPAGYFSSSEWAKKLNMNHRVCQKKLSEYVADGKISVIWARRKSVISIRNMPCYKFKKKSYETSFKG